MRARNSIFEGLVCGGFQTAALAWGLALKTGLFEKCAVAGIGVDKLRWLKPVREGDTIHAEFQLSEGAPTSSRPGIARATFDYRMVNHSRDRKSVVSGKGVSVRVDLGGRRSINTKTNKT